MIEGTMKFKGILMYFLSCQPDRQREFNYWYDIDHVPENRALPGIFQAQRYVAPADYVAAREQSDLKENGGSYLSVYFTEREVLATQDDVAALAIRLQERGRFIDCFRRLFGAAFRTETAAVRQGFPLEPGAVPVMPHQGAYIILDEVTDGSQEQRLIDWYDNIDIPYTLQCPGFFAVFRFRCLKPGCENWILHYFFLDSDPLSALKERNQRLLEQRAQGVARDLSCQFRRIFAGPYQTIVPLQYDFLTSNHP